MAGPVAGQIAALSLDVGGTLMSPAEPVGVTYSRFAQCFGGERSAEQVGRAFRAAWRGWTGPRQIGDGRPFWRAMVSQATGCQEAGLFEALYGHYTLPRAWTLAPGALETLDRLQRARVPVVIASNWDTRLKPTLGALRVLERVSAVVGSGDIGVEKPHRSFFEAVEAAAGVPAQRLLHVGDSLREDVQGARAAGLQALHWGVDCVSFAELEGRLLRA